MSYHSNMHTIRILRGPFEIRYVLICMAPGRGRKKWVFFSANLGTKSCESCDLVQNLSTFSVWEGSGSGRTNSVCDPTEAKMKSENCQTWTKYTHIQSSRPVSITWGVFSCFVVLLEVFHDFFLGPYSN